MRVTTNERAKVIKCLQRGKAAGPDNVAAEALMHSNNRLHYTWSVLLGYADTWLFATGCDGHKYYTISKKTNVVNCQTKITIGPWQYQIIFQGIWVNLVR